MNPNALLHCRHHIQSAHTITPLHEAGMENKIQVVKGPFNILQLAQDKRTQFSSPGLLTASSNGSKSSSEAENLSVSLVILFFCFPFRYHSDSLHRRRAKLRGRQDGGAEPQLLCDHTKQLLRD